MKFNEKYFQRYKDMYNIYNLITKINPGYRLFYNKLKHNYAVININNNFEICYEFNDFLKNILYNLQFSKISNLKNIIKNIDEYNENLELKNIKNSSDLSKQKLNDTLQILNRSNTLYNSDLNKIIGA